MRTAKRIHTDLSSIVDYMNRYEDEMDNLILLNESHEFKDYDYRLLETVVDAIYVNPQEFWDKSNKTHR